MNDLLLTFYGDDFTGSTDSMEQLELGGVPAVLFLDTPQPEQLAHFPDVRAIGIAGVSRSMSPAQMDAELPPKFQALGDLGAPFVHYKICSTFDSSPTIGSIGHAAEIGWRLFAPDFIPLVVGAPFLRRYVVFGNLYARVGDLTYRLDRHPTMSKHPITPMDEADLRLHLGKQTARRIGLVDVWHMMSKSPAELDAYLADLRAEGAEIVVFDTLDETHLHIVGRLLWQQRGQRPVFVVGSSGVELALTGYLRSTGAIAAAPAINPPPPVDQLVVMSGSAAPETADQLQYAFDHGYAGLRLDAPRLVDPATADSERAATIQRALDILSSGRSLILYAAAGPDDPAIAQTKAHLEALGYGAGSVGSRLGTQQGMILRAVLAASGLRRACVTGGDTSGHTARQLGIFALRMRVPIAPGAPLCVASSSEPELDGLEISLKGGQNGKIDYLLAIQRGHA
jgi:uncharacterized protein YgbK (DUF1537 family)